jgi:hypothetical protein
LKVIHKNNWGLNQCWIFKALEAYENAHEPHYVLSIGNLHPKTTHQDLLRYFDGYTYDDGLIKGVGRERCATLVSNFNKTEIYCV